MTGSGRLEGKVAVITGASSGMGAAEAARFVEEGARVVVADIGDEAGQALAESLGERADFFRLDVGDAADWDLLVQEVEAALGGLDVLINNAGIAHAGPLDDLDPGIVDEMYRVNQRGVILGMRAAIAPMRRRGGGSIVNIGSTAALKGEPGLAGYSATKFAVRGMTQVAAAELAEHGIRVNAIHPGAIDTPMHRRNPPDKQAHLLERIPLQRFGDPLEVAAAALFLASDDASYITGADLAVDGGFLLASR